MSNVVVPFEPERQIPFSLVEKGVYFLLVRKPKKKSESPETFYGHTYNRYNYDTGVTETFFYYNIYYKVAEKRRPNYGFMTNCKVYKRNAGASNSFWTGTGGYSTGTLSPDDIVQPLTAEQKQSFNIPD